MKAKSKGNEKSIFLKRHQSSSDQKHSGFKFNFQMPTEDHNSNEAVKEEIQEDLAQVEKFKFVRTDNSFRFNFSSS